MTTWVQQESTRWRPAEKFGVSVRRALATPVAVGITLFIAAVVGAIIFALTDTTPDVIEASPSEQIAHTGGSLGEAGGANEAGADQTPSASRVQSSIMVHVTGEVHEPGVFEIDEGARVIDAITAAGGPTELAVLEHINLARTVADGEQVIVPNAQNATQLGAAEHASTPGGSPQSSHPLNLNSADTAALETLPGIGPALAERIVQWRTTHGPFVQVEQLLEISGIGPSKFAELQALVGV